MRHFWLRNHAGAPVACIASTLQPDSTVAFAIAIQHHKLDDFNRDTGMTVAKGRLSSGRCITIPNSNNIRADILKQIASSFVVWHTYTDAEMPHNVSGAGEWRMAPRRVREAANFWLHKWALLDGVLESSERMDKIITSLETLCNRLLQEIPDNEDDVEERNEMMLHGPDTVSIEVGVASLQQLESPDPLDQADGSEHEPRAADEPNTISEPSFSHNEDRGVTIAGVDGSIRESGAYHVHVDPEPTEPIVMEAPPEPEVEIKFASPEDEDKLNRIFTGVHEREEQPWSWQGNSPD